MAKFLTTVGNSFQIEQIILNAKENLTLVTPYLNISKNIISRLTDADIRNVQITLIYGKREFDISEKRKLESLKNLEIYFCENLHAKCFHNEDLLVITSMNLYEFSERNNREMGLLIERSSDSEIFSDTLKEIESIKNSSIKKKGFNRFKAISSLNLEINPAYNDKRNFHLPSLFDLLSSDYPNHNIVFNDSIIINDFPSIGIDLFLGSTIDFQFYDTEMYEEIIKSKRRSIEDKLSNFRVFWNWKKINIYEAENHVTTISEVGLKEKLESTLRVIDILYNELK